MFYVWDIIGLGTFIAWLVDYFKRTPISYRVQSFSDLMGVIGFIFLMWLFFTLAGPIGAVGHWIWTKFRTESPLTAPKFQIRPTTAVTETDDVKFLDVK